jgi:hypothetical protein
MDLLNTVRAAWAFAGLVPARVLHLNSFGNLLVEDVAGRVWRICPEELACDALDDQSVEEVIASDDWKMDSMVVLATEMLGVPGEGRCFCLKIPGVLGGRYDRDNLGTISVEELIAFSGDLAAQIKDLPDGAKIELKIVD